MRLSTVKIIVREAIEFWLALRYAWLCERTEGQQRAADANEEVL